MKNIIFIILFLVCVLSRSNAQIADKSTYLNGLKVELSLEWPENRTLNLVFHGHSVPTGYFNGGNVMTFDSYPHYVHVALKEQFPYAVINCIRTSIGGENSKQGAARFENTVLNHNPDVLFIDYSLNDRGISLEEAHDAWKYMIEKALERNIKIILLTPTPDTIENILDDNAPLAKYACLVRDLAEEYHIGLVDSYALFKEMAERGINIKDYMSQNNHPNEKGHRIVADEIMTWF